MTPAEFAARCMALDGPRYARWATGWAAADCFGLVALYWREVHGRELHPTPPQSMADGFASMGGAWAECGPLPGACGFMAWHAGQPRHCGVLLPGGELLHTEDPGGPRITRLPAMQRLYPDIRFYAPTAAAFAASPPP